MNRFSLIVTVLVVFLGSCTRKNVSKGNVSISEKSICLLSLDSTIIFNNKWSISQDSTFNEDFIVKLIGESALKMNSGWLTSAYSTSKGLLKSVSKQDSVYFQALFHHFIIANEVDSLTECKRLLLSLGDSVNSGKTWQWQQTYMWMRYYARTWNVVQYQNQKTYLLKMLANQPGRLVEKAITYEQLGHYERNFRNIQQAFQYYQYAIKLYNELGWNKRKYLCQIRYADELFFDGDRGLALKVYGQVPDVSTSLPEVHCRKLLFLSEIEYKSFNSQEEIKQLKLLSCYALKHNLIYWAAEAATRMSSWHLESKSLKSKDSALYYANMTYKFANELQDKDLMANVSADLANVESLLGNFDKAINYAKDNLALRKLQKNLTEEIRSYCRIASLYLEKKEYLLSRQYNDSALYLLDLFPDERPFLTEVFQQRVKIETTLDNHESAFAFRKKQLYWQLEGQKMMKTGNEITQIRQLQSQLFQLSEQLSDIQNKTISYKRADRYLLLTALFLSTLFILLLYGKLLAMIQRYQKLQDELENEKFQINSVRKDFEHEVNQIKVNVVDLGHQFLSHLHDNWRSFNFLETQKRLQLWLKALKVWLEK